MLRVSASGSVGEIPLDEFVIGCVEHHVARRGQTDQLRQRERRLGRASAGRDHDLPHARAAQCGQGVVGDVGAGEVIRVTGEDACHVEGDVAVADDDHPLVVQIDGKVGEVGMAVDPGDQLGGRAGAGQPDARDVEPTVVRRADGVEHGVVVRQKLGVADVPTDLDVEVEVESP